MSRESDSQWYLAHRAALAKQYSDAWLVVLDETVVRTFPSEREAVAFSVDAYGVNRASVFQATVHDPFLWV